MLTPHERASMLAHIIKLYEWTEEQPTTTPCHACAYFGSGAVCRAWGSEPIPADIQPNGCDKWKFNPESMPF